MPHPQRRVGPGCRRLRRSRPAGGFERPCNLSAASLNPAVSSLSTTHWSRTPRPAASAS